MTDLGATFAITAATVLALLLVTWAVSIPARDVSIVDIAWGLAFVDVAWVAAAVAGGDAARTTIAVALASVWGVRLAAYIALRKARHPGEDPRYAKMRERHGDRFPRVSLFTVFLLQAALAWVVSLPLQGAAAATDGRLGPLAYLGMALWLVGFVFEAGGDRQLARFKADPANRGQVMDRGFWRYTRHPNYFGDFAVWWGLFLIAADGGAWWAAVSPLIMTVLLTRVSGKDLLEKSMSARPGYAEYVERTSGFIPLPPKRGRGAAAARSR
jgi:steroid 5-alpha reductase family enzyme